MSDFKKRMSAKYLHEADFDNFIAVLIILFIFDMWIRR